MDTYVDESPAPVQVLDLSTLRWSALSSSSLGEIDARTLVAAGPELVVIGDGPSRIPGGGGRHAARAEIWDGTRWTPYQSDRAAGLGWHWTGQRIISTYRVTRRDACRGGRHDFPAAAFDPARGRWTQLPWLPPAQKGLLEEGWPDAYGPRVVSEGFLDDDRTGSSVPVRAPSPWGNQLQLLTDRALVLVGGSRAVSGLGSRVLQLDLSDHAWILPLGPVP